VVDFLFSCRLGRAGIVYFFDVGSRIVDGVGVEGTGGFEGKADEFASAWDPWVVEEGVGGFVSLALIVWFGHSAELWEMLDWTE
jgi:hypothetical protein